MGYIIALGSGHYIKRTSSFGAYYGSIVITDNKADAFIFTRKSDAEKRAHCLFYRVENYAEDAWKLKIRGLDIANMQVTDVMENAT